jgi:mannose-6-phosphate isomerase-like protein (cupin superfamily)
MPAFQSTRLSTSRVEPAPDGSAVRPLLRLPGGAMAHFELGAGKVSRAVCHRTVSELWFIVSGCGQMWRKEGEHEECISLHSGVCLSIPCGTHFQFRATAQAAVVAIAVTMPPWPGSEEAFTVDGPWSSSDTAQD